MSWVNWLYSSVPAPPSLVVKAFSPPSDPAVREWMLRNGVDEKEVACEAWGVLIIAVAICVPCTLLAFILAGILEALAALVVAVCAPIILSSYIANGPTRMARKEERSYLRHAPAVIGTMAMSMNLAPSLEKAVLLAAEVNDDSLGRRLLRASWEVLTRHRIDLESSLSALASSLDRSNQALRQSLHLLIASSHEPTKEGMERLMEKAHEVSVQGLRQAAERYVAGLGTPVMIIFGLGILLPIMLLSIMPLFALATPLSSEVQSSMPQSMPLAPITFFLLVVVPAGCVLYSRSILESSPTSCIPKLRLTFDRQRLWPWLAWASLLLVLFWLEVPARVPYLLLLALAFPPFLLLMREERARPPRHYPSDPERDFIVGLYQIGNRLSTGASLEKSVAEEAATCSSSLFSDWARTALHRSKVSKMPLEEAPTCSDLAERWPLVAEAFRTVARCAQKDGVAAGRVAVRLANSLGDIRDCEQGIEERLKGVVDMMRSTSTVFAPMVLGVTVGLFGLASSQTGGADANSTVILIAGIYLMELALVVSYLTNFLSSGRTWKDMAHSFATRMPVAVLVFTLVSLLCRAGVGLR